MIDPANITNFNRSQAELEEFLLFCIVVAGKNAKVQAKKLDEFLFNVEEFSPFRWIRALVATNTLQSHLESVKMGQYNRIVRAFDLAAHCIVNLQYNSPDGLECIPGIGPKTARFFVVHSRPDQKYAILDTHILRYMRDVHGIETPKTTPSGKKYLELEKKFLALVPPGMGVAEFDLSIWNHYNAKTFNRDSKQPENAGTI